MGGSWVFKCPNGHVAIRMGLVASSVLTPAGHCPRAWGENKGDGLIGNFYKQGLILRYPGHLGPGQIPVFCNGFFCVNGNPRPVWPGLRMLTEVYDGVRAVCGDLTDHDRQVEEEIRSIRRVHEEF